MTSYATILGMLHNYTYNFCTNEWDNICATITEVSTGETITIRFKDSIEVVSPYVERFAENLFKTKEFDGKLLKIGIMAEETIK